MTPHMMISHWWHSTTAKSSRPPKLAFDHRTILDSALNRLRGKLRYQPVGFELLPKKFTLSELQWIYERILYQQLDKRNFRKKLNKLGILAETDEFQQDVAHRADRLHRFDRPTP